MKLNTDDINRVKDKWGEFHDQSQFGFYAIEHIRKYMLSCLTGESQVLADDDWLEKWIVTEILKEEMPVENCLSICCGFGQKERKLAKLGVFSKCLAIDLSWAAIEEARRLTDQEKIDNIEYLAADIANIHLDENVYDLVYASGALHHISRLEHVLSEVYKSLKPGGLLISDEYVGPANNELSTRHREIINAAMHLIPLTHRASQEYLFVPEFFRLKLWRRVGFEFSRLVCLQPLAINFERHGKTKQGTDVKSFLMKSLERLNRFLMRRSKKFCFGKIWDIYPTLMKKKDPSEGIRSDEIIPIIKTTFKNDVNIRYFNGSILFYALDDRFYQNYDPNSKTDIELLDTLITIEKSMIDLGEIPPIFAHIVAHKS